MHCIQYMCARIYVIFESYMLLMKEREPTGINLMEAFPAFIPG